MAWFEHPVNEAREARGLPAVNSIWFHAQGAAQPVKSPFARVLSDAAATRGLALTAGVATGAPPASFGAVAAAAPTAPNANGASGARDSKAVTGAASTTLIELDPFSGPFIEQDWARWNDAFAALEADWFAPALTALQAGQLGELGLTLCGDTGSVTLTVTRGDLRKFWRRRVLASLLIE
jgi:hypothetical protein